MRYSRNAVEQDERTPHQIQSDLIDELAFAQGVGGIFVVLLFVMFYYLESRLSKVEKQLDTVRQELRKGTQ